MQERVIDIPTRDGQMNSWVFHPDKPGPHPVVILYMDSVGIREELCDMARRIATVGYYVLMPNLYYRMVRSVDLDADRLSDPAYAEKRELMWTLNRALSNCSILGPQTAEACDRLLSRLKVGQRPHLQVEEPIQEGAKTRDLAHPASPPLKQRGPITELPRSGVEPLQVPARFVCVRVTSDSLKPTGDRARLVSGDVRKVKASSRQAL
jgi:hypothetical protein